MLRTASHDSKQIISRFDPGSRWAALVYFGSSWASEGRAGPPVFFGLPAISTTSYLKGYVLAVAIRGAWCLHFGTPGDHFGTREHLGGLWDLQDRLERPITGVSSILR